MKIIKRNGSEATFDSEKIVAAITKANNSEEGTRLSPEQIHDIADYVEYKCNKIGRAVSVEEVQDMVENQIMATGAFDLAKHYVQYRCTLLTVGFLLEFSCFASSLLHSISERIRVSVVLDLRIKER